MNILPFLVAAALAQTQRTGEIRGQLEEMATTNNGVSIQLELASTRVAVLDPIFARVSLINKSKESVRLPRKVFHTAAYLLRCGRYPYTYSFPPESEHYSSTSRQLHPLVPGNGWTIDYETLELPPVQELPHTYWQEIVRHNPRVETRVMLPFAPADRLSHLVTSVGIKIEQRPAEEMRFLSALFSEWMQRVDERVPPDGWEELGANPLQFGLVSLHSPYPDLVEKLLLLEDRLSPGSLRDIVHLIRLTQVISRSQDEQEAVRTVARLLQWLDTLPEIERHCLAMQIISWASSRRQGNEKARNYLVYEVSSRMPERYLYGAVPDLPEQLQFKDYRDFRLTDYANNDRAFKEYRAARDRGEQRPQELEDLEDASPPTVEAPKRGPSGTAGPSPFIQE